MGMLLRRHYATKPEAPAAPVAAPQEEEQPQAAPPESEAPAAPVAAQAVETPRGNSNQQQNNQRRK